MISYRVITSTNDESELAAIVKKVADKFQDFYIKSRLIYGSDKQDIGITITGLGEEEEFLICKIKDVMGTLEKELLSKEFKIVNSMRIV